MEGSVQFSEIQHFYKNSTVFLTGATGFVGKLVLEKILRECHVKHVYVLIRPKNGSTAESRCADIFDAPAFDPLRRREPEFFKKVSLVEGDCEKPGLGLSDADKALIIKEANFVFHCAANTKLDASLKEATNVNVRATRDLLDIAKQTENLKAFVFVSTLFSNFPKVEIHEQIYEPNIAADDFVKAINSLGDHVLDAAKSRFLGDWPNAYTLTKQMAEGLMKEEGKNIPISVVRASHIIPCANEPIAGYVENVYSLSGLAVANALGINRVNYYKSDTLDVIPVDYVVNLLIASGWYVGLQKLRMKRGDINSMDVMVYHCTTSQEKPLTTDEWMGITETVSREVPSSKIIQMPLTFNTACYYNFRFLTFVLHYCMGFLCDLGLKFVGKQPGIVNGYKRLYQLQEQASVFLFKHWYVTNDNTQKLLKRMSFTDRELFNFNVLSLNWEMYFLSFARGIRVYIMKDPMSTLSEGRQKLKKKLHIQLVSAAFMVVVLYVTSKIILFGIFFR